MSVEAAIERARELVGPLQAEALEILARAMVREEMAAADRFMSVGDAAPEIGCTVHQLRKMVDRYRPSLIEAGAIRQAGGPGTKLEVSPRRWLEWNP